MLLRACRLCQSSHIEAVVDLGFHPLADTFLPPQYLEEPEVAYPLRLALCAACGHLFTTYVVSATERYQRHDYSYDSSNSVVSREHFREFAAAVIGRCGLTSASLVADIGSNDGTLLEHFHTLAGCRVVGIEPSANMTAIAQARQISTVNDFFGARAVTQILDQHGKVDVLVSANAMNHADDLDEVWDAARTLLRPNGLFVFEVPYLYELVRRTAFDTIYHEHVHYHSIYALKRSLQRHGFAIEAVESLEYMCGSIRVHARVDGLSSPAVAGMIERELASALFAPATYTALMDRVRSLKHSITAQLANVRASGGTIVGIGAATKGNTLLNYCRLDSDTISYITDASPLKIGKLMPGSHIRIVDDANIGPEATHALILPWNIAPFLQRKLGHLRLEFLVPQPGASMGPQP